MTWGLPLLHPPRRRPTHACTAPPRAHSVHAPEVGTVKEVLDQELNEFTNKVEEVDSNVEMIGSGIAKDEEEVTESEVIPSQTETDPPARTVGDEEQEALVTLR